MSDLLGALLLLALTVWLGRFVVLEVRSGGVAIRVFWLTTAVASVSFLSFFLYAAGQPNW